MAQAGVAYRNNQAAFAGRNRRTRSVSINKIMSIITMAVAAACLFCYFAQLTTIAYGTKEINRIKSEISKMEETQEQLEIFLASQQNIDRIRNAATGRLGMRQPAEGQVQVVSLSGYSVSANTQTAHDNAMP